MEKFEQRLSRQPLRPVPPEWRAEILAAALPASRPVSRTSFLATCNMQHATLLWPHPKAWAGLAAVWVVIILVNLSLRDPSARVAEKSAPPSPEMMAELRKQQRLFAELIGPREEFVADRSKYYSPKPHARRAEILVG